MNDQQNNKLVVFQNKKIRRIWHNDEWYFSVIDICNVLVDSVDNFTARKYWNKLAQRLKSENSQAVTNCHRLKLLAPNGKMHETDCANTANVFRIIQSIPSKKAEPFKMWLAQLGKERIDEVENPELAQERMKLIYEQKGYSKDWIDKRLRGIAIRQNLTDEWQERGITKQDDFSILTAEISKATFGMTPNEYKKFRKIPEKSKANLRDNMTDLELIFSMLGEKVTTEISKKEKPAGLPANKKVAKRGGSVAGNARKATEKELGQSVISEDNNLAINRIKNPSKRWTLEDLENERDLEKLN